MWTNTKEENPTVKFYFDSCRILYSMDPFIQEFPVLADCRCVRARLYRYIDSLAIYCERCHLADPTPRCVIRGSCHLSVYGGTEAVSCTGCGDQINTEETLNTCPDCFITTLETLRILRLRGFDSNHLIELVVDTKSTRVLKFRAPRIHSNNLLNRNTPNLQ